MTDTKSHFKMKRSPELSSAHSGAHKDSYMIFQ